MISFACNIVAATLVVFSAGHLLMACLFRIWLKRKRHAEDSPSSRSAHVVPGVILCARGVDDSFPAVIEGLQNQLMPARSIVVATDKIQSWPEPWSRDWQRDELSAGGPLVQRRLIHPDSQTELIWISGIKRLPDCGLKCSALLEALQHLPAHINLVAFIDSDVVPHPTWLGELVRVAMVPDCGVATGVPWFDPADSRTGTLVRSLWNAAAMFPTAMAANPWAGSMAMQRQVIESCGLKDKWAESIVDDGPVRQSIVKQNLRPLFVPSLVMSNADSCSIGFAANWIGRMMKWSSIYERDFLNTAIHAAFTGGLLVSAFICVIASLINGSDGWNRVVGGLLAGNILQVAGWWVMRGSSLQAGPLQKWITKTMLMVPLVTATQLLHVFAVARAVFSRRYRWRGVLYEIESNGRSRIIEST